MLEPDLAYSYCEVPMWHDMGAYQNRTLLPSSFSVIMYFQGNKKSSLNHVWPGGKKSSL